MEAKVNSNMASEVKLTTRWTLVWMLLLCSFIATSNSELSLPFPSLIQEIRPTLSIYSSSGDPPCFTIPAISGTARDLVRIAEGHGAWRTSRVIFITHGYKDSVESNWLHVLKNTLVSERDQTVVLVGWGGGADLPQIKYNKAAGNIRSVGAWLGEIVGELRKMHPKMYIWGVGHSLGAHLFGVAAREGGNRDGFDRITGLDPAGPYFEDKNLDMRLNRMDADVVDVIHSDGCSTKTNPQCWVSANNHYATLLPLGTIDFYPNYGELNPTTHPLDIHASHKRAINLFIASVMHKGLFRTNETIEGSPGPSISAGGRGIERIRTVGVVAEMGYWLETGFLPTPVDPRVNFYLSSETLKAVDRMGDLSSGTGMRHRRDLVKAIDCLKVPSGGVMSREDLVMTLVAVLVATFGVGFLGHLYLQCEQNMVMALSSMY